MKKSDFSTIDFVILALIFSLTATAQTILGPLRPEGMAIVEVPLPAMVMVGRSGMPPFRIAAPAHLAAQPQTATFTIQYLNAGEVNFFGDTSIGWPADA